VFCVICEWNIVQFLSLSNVTLEVSVFQRTFSVCCHHFLAVAFVLWFFCFSLFLIIPSTLFLRSQYLTPFEPKKCLPSSYFLPFMYNSLSFIFHLFTSATYQKKPIPSSLPMKNYSINPTMICNYVYYIQSLNNEQSQPGAKRR
jgi:hypothetical protein